jgi:hypothetical protein
MFGKMVVGSKQGDKMKFKTFDQMMGSLGGYKFKDSDEISKNEFAEEVGGFLAISANNFSQSIAVDFAKQNGLSVVTECLGDDGDDVVYSYSNGLHFINRERYFFVKKDIDFYFEENVSVD